MKYSKTIIVNVLAIAAGIGTYVLDHNLIANNPDLVAALGMALGLVNLGLRYLTKEAVTGWFTKG